MACAFLDNCEWFHDSNITINILMQTLALFQIKLGKLPLTLYLEIDNCYRECKNKYVIAFLAILVKLGLFRKIKLSFLMVGHTHEDIDQMFSCFSRHLAKHYARTIPELVVEMGKGYTPTLTCEQLLCMFDVKQWMDGHILNDVSGHVHQDQFKFEVKGGKVLTFYKKWSTSKKWIHLKPKNNKDPLFSIIQSMPNSGPLQYVKPSTDAVYLSKIVHDLVKFNAKFDNEATNWWKKHLDNMKSSTYFPVPWCLESLLDAQKTAPLVELNASENEVEVRASEEIERLLEKETNNTKVKITEKSAPRKHKRSKENGPSVKRAKTGAKNKAASASE